MIDKDKRRYPVTSPSAFSGFPLPSCVTSFEFGHLHFQIEALRPDPAPACQPRRSALGVVAEMQLVLEVSSSYSGEMNAAEGLMLVLHHWPVCPAQELELCYQIGPWVS